MTIFPHGALSNNCIQLCKFVAKLRLLEYGFLVAAKALDDINYSTKKKRSADDDEGDEPAESYEAYEQRISLYVAAHMATASGSKRDAYKDGLVYQARKDVIQDFIKTTMTRKCQNPNCNA